MTPPRPPAPGSPEARAIMAAFKAGQCQYFFGGKAYKGAQCTDRARYPLDAPRYCAEHRKGVKRSSPAIPDIAVWSER